MSKEIVYIANPMCSWCYGFSPVIERVREQYTERVDAISLMLGSFELGEMNDDLRNYLRKCWQSVSAATGAEFQHDFFNRQGFVYDSTNPCRAVYLAKELGAKGADFTLLKILQRAFYRGNRDITDLDTLVELASEAGVNSGEFSSRIRADANPEEMTRNFREIEKRKINGYPVTLLIDEVRTRTIVGYHCYGQIAPFIEAWLSGELDLGHRYEQQSQPSLLGTLKDIVSNLTTRAVFWLYRKSRGK